MTDSATRCNSANRVLAAALKRVELRDPKLADELARLDPFDDRAEMEVMVKDAEFGKRTEKFLLERIKRSANSCKDAY